MGFEDLLTSGSAHIRSSVRLFANGLPDLARFEDLQYDLNNLAQWETDWQMKFNVACCQMSLNEGDPAPP